MTHHSLQQVTRLLSDEQILRAYDEVSAIYPFEPSLSMWRAWEYAAYRLFPLEAPVLDVGCGDGRLFRLAWPHINDVYGIDIDPEVVSHAQQSGIYREVWQADAANLTVEPSRFASIFANCSLEHMDQIEQVLQNLYRALRPGGRLVFSIVNDQLAPWFLPGQLVRTWGDNLLADQLYQAWLDYHHLVNPLPIEGWCAALEQAGFELVEHVPILPAMSGQLFLLLDGLWHHRQNGAELGQQLAEILQARPYFPTAFRTILAQVLALETDRAVGCGAVLVAQRPPEAGLEAPLPPAHPAVSASELRPRDCWCGGSLAPFSSEYLRCTDCDTLVSQAGMSTEQLLVQSDDDDFYGKNYWLSHQQQSLGLPSIFERTRADLPERCLYWLRTLLRYRLPPARLLELGSAHGGFVALAAWAGFDATGQELSPWVTNFAHETFGIPMLTGLIEEQGLAEGELDVIVLNDVLEHLPDPLGTMGHCLRLLKPDGLLLIQTPCYRGQSYEALRTTHDRFLEHMDQKAEQHLYLFSQQAARQLFERLGCNHIQFEPAIFDYDMYFVASRAPLHYYSDAAVSTALLASPSGRLTLALLDKEAEAAQQRSAHQQMEAHAAARLEIIQQLQQALAASEADRAARLEVIQQLQQALAASEADRAARLEVINDLKAHLDASEADRAARLEVIHQLQSHLAALNAFSATNS